MVNRTLQRMGRSIEAAEKDLKEAEEVLAVVKRAGVKTGPAEARGIKLRAQLDQFRGALEEGEEE